MNSDFLVYEAKSFYNAYIALDQLREEDNLLYHVPAVVVGAFSIELSIKAILTKFGIEYEKEHNLLSLFNLLPDRLKKLYWKYLVTKAPEYDDEQKQIEELTLISNAFVDMRYIYEVKLVPMVNTRFLAAFANTSIYMMFALGFNVDLVEAERAKSREEVDKMIEDNRKNYINKVNEQLAKDSKKKKRKRTLD